MATLPVGRVISLGRGIVAALRKFLEELGGSAADFVDLGAEATNLADRMEQAVEDLEENALRLAESIEQQESLLLRREQLGC